MEEPINDNQLFDAPIILKNLCTDCEISQTHIARITGVSRPAINVMLNHGCIPKKPVDFQKIVEDEIGNNSAAIEWLRERNLAVADIWMLNEDETKPPTVFDDAALRFAADWWKSIIYVPLLLLMTIQVQHLAVCLKVDKGESYAEQS
ncbi:MAG: hypothetical protein ABFD75_11320 [Smithella sp.]